jgi:hypothetical protein
LADSGGGVSGGALYNCIVYYNDAPNGANYDGGTLNYCCTTPDPGEIGNIVDEPMFVSTNSVNYRLQAGSPCIDAGTNQQWMIGATDLDGLARIRGGRVDMGAYEYEYIPSAWLAQYGLPSDGSADLTDNDGDRMNNWREWRCGTNPTNALSVLKLDAPFMAEAPSAGIVIRWESVEGKIYRLRRGTNLVAVNVFSNLADNIVGLSGWTVYTDATVEGSGPYFYNVGVK